MRKAPPPRAGGAPRAPRRPPPPHPLITCHPQLNTTLYRLVTVREHTQVLDRARGWRCPPALKLSCGLKQKSALPLDPAPLDRSMTSGSRVPLLAPLLIAHQLTGEPLRVRVHPHAAEGVGQ